MRPIKVWWSLYMIDIWSSMGLGLSRQFEFVEILPFPLDEQDFLSIRETQPLAKSSSRGLWAEMVMLARIWAGIHQLNRASADGLLVLSEVEAETQKLADELQAWSDRLHPSLQESHANLERYTRLGLGNAYAALHLGYHYYHEVLFYQFLGGPVHSESHSRQQWRIKCQKHAVAFCDLLYHCRALGQCQCVYVMVGHMLVITSTVYIHTLLFGDEEQKPLVRHRLVRNFKILTELQTFWAALDMALLRLQIFHNACMQSIDRSFCMDRWLLRFIQHGSSITERPLPDVEQSNDRSDRQSATDWWNWFLETL
ncbi:hypothetical protein BDV25DRAFT_152471 [Aspergillus avenaceus]|uniref:Xylanolytic transcriptional activator regulatory domain-containing protein n=1 Tax=Aspergillus avenaceus TaxID=36643 RepID=A0A5N6U000_ASPAV|nr:hypothetical protein BDV25DRAFT_152471 [Aspergillus avenaceus]